MFNTLYNSIFQYIKKTDTKTSVNQSVSDFILMNLIYFQNNGPSNYPSDNLTIKDIKQLVQQIDFSHISYKKQEKVLQDILIISHLSPLVAKLFKSNVISADIQTQNDLAVLGKIKEKYMSKEVPNTILVPTGWKTATFIHEYLHLKQGYDGLFNFRILFPHMYKMAEANAKGFDFIIASYLNNFMAKTYPFYNKDKTIDFVHKIISKRLDLNKSNCFSNQRERLCFAEEETVGILMRCLLTHKKEHRLQILNKFVPNALKTYDISCLNKHIKEWRSNYYVDATDLMLDFNNPDLKKELESIPFVNAYYTNQTHIPISCLNLKIKNKKTLLFQILQQQKEKG